MLPLVQSLGGTPILVGLTGLKVGYYLRGSRRRMPNIVARPAPQHKWQADVKTDGNFSSLSGRCCAETRAKV